MDEHNRWQETNSVDSNEEKEQKYIHNLSGLGIVSINLFVAIFLPDEMRKNGKKMRTVTRTKRDNGVTADRITPSWIRYFFATSGKEQQ